MVIKKDKFETNFFSKIVIKVLLFQDLHALRI